MPDKQYVFSKDTLHFFTHDDICAMYNSGMSINLIAHKLSRVLGLTVATCKTAVYSAITSHMLPVASPYSACTPFLCDDTDGFTPAHVSSPFPTSWAVGDLCTRRE